MPPTPRSAQQCFFGNYFVPQHEEVAPTPTGCESLWYDTFGGSHAAASEKRQHNLSCTSSKYKTLNGSCSPLTTDQNAEDGWHPVLEALSPWGGGQHRAVFYAHSSLRNTAVLSGGADAPAPCPHSVGFTPVWA